MKCNLFLFWLLCLCINARLNRHSQHGLLPKNLSTFLTLESSKLSLGLTLLAKQRALVERGQLPKCEGLVEEMCQPCPQGGPKDFCDDIKKQCSELFCSPMCRRNTWTCNVTFGKLEKENAKKADYTHALCAEFAAEFCTHTLQCCQDDDLLFDWIENEVFGDHYPKAFLPSPSCIKTDGGTDMCTTCQKNVKVQMKAGKCPFPTDETPKTKTKPKPAKGPAGDLGFPGEPAFKSLQERCESLLSHVTNSLPKAHPIFEEKACQCMGCCPGECFFPVFETTTTEKK